MGTEEKEREAQAESPGDLSILLMNHPDPDLITGPSISELDSMSIEQRDQTARDELLQ